MFNVPNSKLKTFAEPLEEYVREVAASDVLFHNIRLLNGRHRILDKKTFDAEYKTFTSDIELQTSPLDSIIPNSVAPTDTPDVVEPEDLVKQRLFLINRNEETVPEYGRIKRRITEERIREDLNETHPVIVALVKGEVTMDDIVDDVFIYWSVYKYIEEIQKLHIQMFATMNDLIEWVTTTFTLDDFLKAIHTKKYNAKKINKYREESLFFFPTEKKICDFYAEDERVQYKFDLLGLVNLLLSNTDTKYDFLIALAVYLIADYAVADIIAPDGSQKSPCEAYVRDVLSKIPVPAADEVEDE